MQPSSGNNSLSSSAQLANAERDGSVSPYLQNVSSRLNAVSEILQDARQSVARLSIHSDPQQKEAVQQIEARLIMMGNDVHQLRQSVQQAVPRHDQTLSRDGLHQFNAAARGDARSVVHQLENLSRPVERMPGTLSAELRAAALDSGQTKPSRDQQSSGVERTSELGQGSQQVARQQPTPIPRPTKQFAAGVDAIKHRQEMAIDDVRAQERNDYLRSLAADLKSDRQQQPELERGPTLTR